MPWLLLPTSHAGWSPPLQAPTTAESTEYAAEADQHDHSSDQWITYPGVLPNIRSCAWQVRGLRNLSRLEKLQDEVAHVLAVDLSCATVRGVEN